MLSVLNSVARVVAGVTLICGVIAAAWFVIGFMVGIAARAAHFAFGLLA